MEFDEVEPATSEPTDAPQFPVAVSVTVTVEGPAAGAVYAAGAEDATQLDA